MLRSFMANPYKNRRRWFWARRTARSDHADDIDEDGSKERRFWSAVGFFAEEQLRTRIWLEATLLISQADVMQSIATRILAEAQNAPQPIMCEDDLGFALVISKIKVRLRSDWNPLIVDSIETWPVIIVGKSGTVEETRFSDYLTRTWPLIAESFLVMVKEGMKWLEWGRVQNEKGITASASATQTELNERSAMMKVSVLWWNSGRENTESFEVEVTGTKVIMADWVQAWAWMTTALRHAPEEQVGAYYVTPNVEITQGAGDVACVVNVTQRHLPDYQPPESQRWQGECETAVNTPVAVLGFPVRRSSKGARSEQNSVVVKKRKWWQVVRVEFRRTNVHN
ncbi:hypothetical protein GGI35DRAFT_463004 [Trichoderma velutinum]